MAIYEEDPNGAELKLYTDLTTIAWIGGDKRASIEASHVTNCRSMNFQSSEVWKWLRHTFLRHLKLETSHSANGSVHSGQHTWNKSIEPLSASDASNFNSNSSAHTKQEFFIRNQIRIVEWQSWRQRRCLRLDC